MTPQLQQAVMLLQLSIMELEQLVEQELEQNPVLEVSDSPLSETPPDQAATPQENIEPVATTKEETLNGQESKAVEEVNWDELFPDDRNWEPSTPAEQPQEDHDGYLSRIASTTMEDLNDNLLSQARLSDLSPKEFKIAETIIGNIDPDGYLRTPMEDIARESESTVEEVEKVLKIIQKFDPPGVAARDLRECLLNQCNFLKIQDPVIRALLQPEHFPDFEHRRFPQVAKATGYSLLEIQEAVNTIAKLDPKPGSKFNNETPRYILPDVVVRQGDDGQYEISLNDESVPRLKISPVYQEMLKNKGKIPKEQYDFVLEKFRAARTLIRNIEHRGRTIVKVTDEIMKTQRAFLEKGVEYLKPLKLREIADKVGVHESTVARVTTNKYVQTPHGIFELKYFFSTGLDSQGGESVSARSIRQMIENMVAEENPNKPLSDQAIANIIKTKGIDIARRTVAKYREQLKILPAHMRKRKS